MGEKKENKKDKGDKGDRGNKRDKAKTSDYLEELKNKLEECQKQKEEYLKGWQRGRADFLNYKKEEMKRIEELVKYANTGLVMKVFPVLDSFYSAEKNMPEELREDDNIKGLLQIRRQLQDILKKEGVEQIECLGKNFDPKFHEVVEMVESGKGKFEKAEPGTVVEEIQRGYQENGRVLRPAKVKVVK